MTLQSKMANVLLAIVFVFVPVIGRSDPARILRHPRAVPGRWMVLLSNTVSKEAFDGVVNSLANTYGLTITTRWPERSLGFVCDNAAETNISKLAEDPRVQLIEQDYELVLSGTQDTVWNAQYLWELDRLDEPTYWTSDSTYDMCPEGRSIYAYVIDTGVRTDHEQFNLNEPSDRVVYSRAFDTQDGSSYVDTTSGCTQGQVNYNLYHGTAVASALAGTTVGSAKTQVISLRVWGCNQDSRASYVVSALRWIRSSTDPYANQPALVNWSGAIPPWATTTDKNNVTVAVNDLVTQTGIPFFAAADNYSGDACQFVPASLAYTNVNHSGTVFSVGGSSVGADSDKNDYRWQTWSGSQPLVGVDTGSNGGGCVSLYAPAVSIYVADNSGPTGYRFLDGTSFSSPLVAGIAARYMEQTGIRNYTQVYDYLLGAAASTGTVVNHVGTIEYWLCAASNGSGVQTWLTSPGTCPAGYIGVNGTSTPVHMSPTNNESNAGMVYSDMACP